MPNRYSLNVRPVYRDDELTGPEQINKGIGSAIELYLRNKAAEGQWENQVADQGGTVYPGESPLDKVRRVGTSIRKHLPGYDPMPEAEQNLDRNRGVLEPQITAHDIPREGDYEAPTPGGVVPIRGPRNPAMDTRGTARDGVTRSPIADAIEQSIQKSPVTGYGGVSAIMPSARGRNQQKIQDEIPLVEARAGGAERERIETMRGDNAMRLETQKQTNRQALEDDKQAARQDLERIKAQRQAAKANGNTLQERRLAVMEENAQARLIAMGVGIDRTLASERTPEGVDRVVAARDPASAGRIAATDASKAAARGRLQRTRQSLAVPAPRTGASAPTVPIAQRIAELKKLGFSKEQARAKLRSEGYKLDQGQ